jgi:hypothetical protein
MGSKGKRMVKRMVKVVFKIYTKSLEECSDMQPTKQVEKQLTKAFSGLAALQLFYLSLVAGIMANVQKMEQLRVELGFAVKAGDWRRAEGILGQIWLLGGIIIASVMIAIVVYAFLAIGTGLSFGFNTDQKGNISSIGNTGAATLQFLPLLALAIIVSVVLGVLLSMFLRRR